MVFQILNDDGFRFSIYLGGKWGRFWYEKIGLTIIGLYLAIITTPVAIEGFILRATAVNFISDYLVFYYLVCIVLDIYIAVRIAPKIVSKITDRMQKKWNKFIKDKPIKLYNFSKTPYVGNEECFSQYIIPPDYIMGISTEHDRIHFYDFFMDKITVRATGTFREADIAEIKDILIDQLNLIENLYGKPWEIQPIQYINKGLYEKRYQKKQIDLPSYGLSNQRKEDRNNPSNHLVVSLIWILFLSVMNYVFVNLSIQYYDSGNLIGYGLSFPFTVFFITLLGLSLTLLDVFNSEGSVYNT